jgi:transcriptional regulator with XRE-family HTH domain
MNSEFGRILKELRLAVGLGQTQFADMLRIKPSNLSAIEHGRRNPPEDPDRLREIASVLGLEENSEDWKRFFDAAAACRGDELPADVRHMAGRKLVPVLLRTIDDKQLSDDELAQLIAEIEGRSKASDHDS